MKLPLNCSATYHDSFLSETESNELFNYLMGLERLTQMHQIQASTKENYSLEHGKLMFLNRDLYEENKFPESLWGATAIWPEALGLLKERIMAITGHEFPVGVCIYYPDGNSGVGYHSDFRAFGNTNIIPSLSLGEERTFYLRELATKKVHSMVLENGSLLVMGDNCQERYEHSLPRNPQYKKPRINITFRKFGSIA